MKKDKTCMYVFHAVYQTGEDYGTVCEVYKDREKARRRWKQYVADEKKSDFVMENEDYEEAINSDYITEEIPITDGIVAAYYFGSSDSQFFTQAYLYETEVIE